MAEADPIALFRSILEEAEATGMRDPNAMCLATVASDGQPSTRMVLLKSVDERGFVFYTNLDSRKGEDIKRNPRVSLTFYWRELERQVQVRGVTHLVDPAEADAYFATRPRGCQLGAWASHQSRPLSTRVALIAGVARLEAQYLGRAVPRPPNWSGYRVAPAEIEFWAAGRFRLHDRTLYRREGSAWTVTRLYP